MQVVVVALVLMVHIKQVAEAVVKGKMLPVKLCLVGRMAAILQRQQTLLKDRRA